jgi:hypothetical protein
MTQPEALRLAKILENIEGYRVTMTAAAELRRLHALNREMLAALKDVYENCDWYGDDGREAMSKARAAIAKGELK